VSAPRACAASPEMRPLRCSSPFWAQLRLGQLEVDLLLVERRFRLYDSRLDAPSGVREAPDIVDAAEAELEGLESLLPAVKGAGRLVLERLDALAEDLEDLAEFLDAPLVGNLPLRNLQSSLLGRRHVPRRLLALQAIDPQFLAHLDQGPPLDRELDLRLARPHDHLGRARREASERARPRVLDRHAREPVLRRRLVQRPGTRRRPPGQPRRRRAWPRRRRHPHRRQRRALLHRQLLLGLLLGLPHLLGLPRRHRLLRHRLLRPRAAPGVRVVRRRRIRRRAQYARHAAAAVTVRPVPHHRL